MRHLMTTRIYEEQLVQYLLYLAEGIASHKIKPIFASIEEDYDLDSKLFELSYQDEWRGSSC
jgi:hypothetical protein